MSRASIAYVLARTGGGYEHSPDHLSLLSLSVSSSGPKWVPPPWHPRWPQPHHPVVEVADSRGGLRCFDRVLPGITPLFCYGSEPEAPDCNRGRSAPSGQPPNNLNLKDIRQRSQKMLDDVLAKHGGDNDAALKEMQEETCRELKKDFGNYAEKIILGLWERGITPTPGFLSEIEVSHDDWCAIFAGRPCDCLPTINYDKIKRPS